MPQPVTYRGMSFVIPDNDSEWNEYFATRGSTSSWCARARRAASCAIRPPMPAHGAWISGWRWQELSGKGTIHSYEIVMHAIQPGFKEITPYAVVLVELDEQRGKPTPDEALRIIGNLVKADFSPEDEAKVAIGKRVRVVFQDLADHFALPQFTLTDEAPVGRVWRLGG